MLQSIRSTWSNGRCPRVRIYTHPTCLIRRQQWHNKSWRLQSRLPGRVRQTDRPSNAFIIILNHIFSSLSLYPGPSFHIVRSTAASALCVRFPFSALQFNAISSFSLLFILFCFFTTSCGCASNISISPPPARNFICRQRRFLKWYGRDGKYEYKVWNACLLYALTVLLRLCHGHSYYVAGLWEAKGVYKFIPPFPSRRRKARDGFDICGASSVKN